MHADINQRAGLEQERRADLEIVPEADLNPTRGSFLHHDQVGDGTKNGEIARQGGCHGDGQPCGRVIWHGLNERLHHQHRRR
jgi:hypothetical protein